MVIRMVLIGESGTGKSYVGNSILGRGVFPVSTKGHVATRTCAVGETTRFGTKFIVVDTPGFFDGNDIDGEIKNTVKRCVELTHPGPQVFLFVFSCSSKYCENDVCVINWFKDYFGDDLYRHAVIIFTQKNSKLCKGSITKFLRSSPKELRDLIELCGNRVAAIDNASSSESEIEVDVRKLISIVVDLVNDRNLCCLTFDSVNNNIITESNTPTNSSLINHAPVSLQNSVVDGDGGNTKGRSDSTSEASKETHSIKDDNDKGSFNQTNSINEPKTDSHVNSIRHGEIPNFSKQASGESAMSDTKDKPESSTRKCMWYDCSDELTKQQITLLREELSQMAFIKRQLTAETQSKSASTTNSDVDWCEMAEGGISMITQFTDLINDIFRDEVKLLSPSKQNRSITRKGAVRKSKH